MSDASDTRPVHQTPPALNGPGSNARPVGWVEYEKMVMWAQAGDPPPVQKWKSHLDSMVRQIPTAPGLGLDADLHEACAAAWTAVRECKRLLLAVWFLLNDRETYQELSAGVHEAVERAHRAHSRVDVRLRQNGGGGALTSLLNDALTVRTNAPLIPPASQADYSTQLNKLNRLQQDTEGRRLFQRRDGVAITEAVFHELCQIPHRDELARVVPEPKAKRSPPPEPTLQRQLANGLKVLKAKGVTSVSQILDYLNDPAGAKLHKMAHAILTSNPTKRGSKKQRRLRDVIEAAVAMRDRDHHNTTS